MSTQNVELVQGIYDAFAAGNLANVLARMSPDIVWNEAENFPYADGNPYIGHEAVVNGVFGRCITEWEGFAVTVHEILDAGDTIVVLGRYQGVFKATGRKQNTQMAHVWRIVNGKASRFQQYADTLHVSKITRVVDNP